MPDDNTPDDNTNPAFYVDVGDLPPERALEILKKMRVEIERSERYKRGRSH